MSNLKKVLALGLVFVLAFALLVPSMAFTDDSDIQFLNEAIMLNQLDILKGMPDGSFGGDLPVERGQMAKMIYVAMNGGIDDGATQFRGTTVALSDIANDWAVNYIKWAFATGIVAGNGAGQFESAGEVTGFQAAKMLLGILGYKADREGFTGPGWEVNVAICAQEAGLFVGLEGIEGDQPLTRNQAAKMIYNTIFARMVAYNVEGARVVASTISELGSSVFATVKLRMIEVTGVLTANEYASVINGGATEIGKSELFVSGLDTNLSRYVTLATSSELDMLGQTVNAWVRIKEGQSVGDNLTKLETSKIERVYGTITLDPDVNKVYTRVAGGMGNILADNKLEMKKNFGHPVDGTDTAFLATSFVSINYTTVKSTDNLGVNTYLTTADIAADPVARGNLVKVIDNNNDRSVDFIIALNQSYDKAQIRSNGTKIGINQPVNTYNRVSVMGNIDVEDVVGAADIENDDRILVYPLVSGREYSWVAKAADSFTGTMTATTNLGQTATISGTVYEGSNISGVHDGAGNALNGKPMILITINANMNKELTYYTDGTYIVDVNVDNTILPEDYALIYDINGVKSTTDPNKYAIARVRALMSDGSTNWYDVAKINGADPKYVSNQYYNDDVTSAYNDNLKNLTVSAFTEDGVDNVWDTADDVYTSRATLVKFTKTSAGALEITIVADRGGVLGAEYNQGASMPVSSKNYAVDGNSFFFIANTADKTAGVYLGRTSVPKEQPQNLGVDYVTATIAGQSNLMRIIGLYGSAKVSSTIDKYGVIVSTVWTSKDATSGDYSIAFQLWNGTDLLSIESIKNPEGRLLNPSNDPGGTVTINSQNIADTKKRVVEYTVNSDGKANNLQIHPAFVTEAQNGVLNGGAGADPAAVQNGWLYGFIVEQRTSTLVFTTVGIPSVDGQIAGTTKTHRYLALDAAAKFSTLNFDDPTQCAVATVGSVISPVGSVVLERSRENFDAVLRVKDGAVVDVFYINNWRNETEDAANVTDALNRELSDAYAAQTPVLGTHEAGDTNAYAAGVASFQSDAANSITFPSNIAIGGLTFNAVATIDAGGNIPNLSASGNVVSFGGATGADVGKTANITVTLTAANSTASYTATYTINLVSSATRNTRIANLATAVAAYVPTESDVAVTLAGSGRVWTVGESLDLTGESVAFASSTNATHPSGAGNDTINVTVDGTPVALTSSFWAGSVLNFIGVTDSAGDEGSITLVFTNAADTSVTQTATYTITTAA